MLTCTLTIADLITATNVVRDCLNNVASNATAILNSAGQLVPLLSPRIVAIVNRIGTCLPSITSLDLNGLVNCINLVVSDLGAAVGATLSSLRALLNQALALLPAIGQCVASGVTLLGQGLNSLVAIINACP